MPREKYRYQSDNVPYWLRTKNI